MSKDNNKTKQIVKKHYGKIAGGGGCCGCSCGSQTENEKIAKDIGKRQYQGIPLESLKVEAKK